LPACSAIVSTTPRIVARSCCSSIPVSGSELVMPWPIHSQSRAMPARMICGLKRQTSALSATVARMPYLSNRSIIRQMPTRGP